LNRFQKRWKVVRSRKQSLKTPKPLHERLLLLFRRMLELIL
jgi:hypothetical protein